MSLDLVRRFIVVGAILALPVVASAQEAVLSGTVTDSTGAVLPGVTIRAVLEASGNNFEGVTDQRGIYRIPVRVGGYKITAELQNFTTVTRSGVELLVGQTAVIDMQLAPSSIAEAVTVTADTPLIDTKSSSLGGNIDPRQVQGIPVNGRNWIALALLAPGSRTGRDPNLVTPLPDRNNGEAREFQLNVDGLVNKCPPTSAPAGSPSTARIRSRNSSSSRTGSTRRWAGRRACR